jgi:hypothetical protein
LRKQQIICYGTGVIAQIRNLQQDRAMPNPTPAARPHRVIVFSTPTCPWCERAKTCPRGQGVPFRDVDVSRDQTAD